MNEEYEPIQISHQPKNGTSGSTLMNISFYKRILFHKPALMPHSTTTQTILTINQCGISSNVILHYQKVLQISLWIQKQVWCKQSLICQSSVEAMGMAVLSCEIKNTQENSMSKKNPFEGKTTVIIKVHPWMCTFPFPSLPTLTPQRAAENNKGRQRNLCCTEQTAAQRT